MSVNLRGTLIPLAACGVVAALSMAVGMTQRDTSAATTAAVITESATAAIPAVVLPIGENDAAAQLIGAEPDPAGYDRQGLEWWWRTYQRSHSLATAH